MATSPPTRGRATPAAVFAVVALSTLGFQAAYVFLPAADVVRADGYDSIHHRAYYQYVRQHPENPAGFRGDYVWVHFPFFYEWNNLMTDAVCRFAGDGCPTFGLKTAWFLQAVLRLGTLALLLAALQRLLRPAGVALAAFVLFTTSPRVYFSTCIWNQNEYIFFFAAICMYFTVAASGDGLSLARIAGVALAAAVGFHFKLTMLLPIAATVFVIVLLPAHHASPRRKVLALAVIAVAVLVVNRQLFTTPDGIIRLTWARNTQYPTDRRNSQDPLGAYLTLSPGPILHPEKIYVPVKAYDPETRTMDWTGRNSALTCAYLYLFELYDNFQGPERTWLNLLCVWSGTPLLVLVLWRTGRALSRPKRLVLDEAYCAMIIVLSALALLAFSLNQPWGWSPHPEYVLLAYPAAAVLLGRQLIEVRSRPLRTAFVAVAALHVMANVALLAHIAWWKITLSL